MVPRIILLCVLACLSACFGYSRPTRFYVLSALAKNTGEISGTRSHLKKIVTVGPIELAKYLERTNIVYHSGANELIVSDFDSWAEGLDRSIARIISQNISKILNSSELTISPWQTLADPDLEIPIGIEKFDCNEVGLCTLRILWSTRQLQGKVLSPLSVHDFEMQAKSSSVEDQTKTLSELLAQASVLLAGEI